MKIGTEIVALGLFAFTALLAADFMPTLGWRWRAAIPVLQLHASSGDLLSSDLERYPQLIANPCKHVERQPTTGQVAAAAEPVRGQNPVR